VKACVEGREEPGVKFFAIEGRDLEIIFVVENSSFVSECNLVKRKDVPRDKQSIWEGVLSASVILWCKH